MSLLFNIDDTAVVEKVTMKWPSDDYFIPAGTPMSRTGIANDENAVGILASPAKVEFTFPDSIAKLIGKKEPKGNIDYTFDIITAGFVDIKKAEASFGSSIETAAKSAMSGIKFVESASDLGGDCFEIKFDWDNMTCNHSASEIREAYNCGKPFVGVYIYDGWNNAINDENNNIATVFQWEPTSYNSMFKYIVHEDKSVEEIYGTFRPIANEPIRITVDSYNAASYSSTELDEIISNNKYESVPLIYLIKNGFVYHLCYYSRKTELSDATFRFACITTNTINFASMGGDNKIVEFTEKAY